MNQELTKEVAQKLMEIKGNVRGEAIRVTATFIQKKEGEKGLKDVEGKMAELGYPLNFNKIKPERWYPESLSVLVILVAKDLFDWSEKDIFELGNSAPKYSFIAKMLIRYFSSYKRFLKEVPKYWRKHFDFGELEVSEFNEEKRYLVLREKGYKFHPLLCVYHAGYYLRIAQYVIKSEKITIEETKCIFKGDPYHEYTIRWK
jgi:hypothetical protein